MTISTTETAERIAREHTLRYVKQSRRWYRCIGGAWQPIYVSYLVSACLRAYAAEPGLSHAARRRMSSSAMLTGCEFQLKRLCASLEAPKCARFDEESLIPLTDGRSRVG